MEEVCCEKEVKKTIETAEKLFDVLKNSGLCSDDAVSAVLILEEMLKCSLRWSVVDNKRRDDFNSYL